MTAADPIAAAAQDFERGSLAGRVELDRPLGPLTTYRVGGPASLFVEVGSADDVEEVSRVVATTGIEVLVVGKGSNLLVADAGFEGLAVLVGAGLAGIAIDGVDVRAGGAASLPVIARRTAAAGLTGFEWAVGVPGSVGGAVRMNAGGHGADMSESLVDARVIDVRSGDDRRWSLAELQLGYRRSAIRGHHVVLDAGLQLVRGSRSTSEAEIAEIVAWRRANQPGGQNAGSVFTNPPDDSAGRLIDEAGCKGRRVGTAAVSTKHANFIQADEGGSADDVHALVEVVRDRVRETSGILLAVETRVVGFPGDDQDGDQR